MSKELNPFSRQEQKTALVEVESSKALQEVQAAMVIAKRFPRDQAACMDRILRSCMRPTLAESAIFAYPRGRQIITGPSIRLAEALAQGWTNVHFGIREIEQRRGESTMESYAWDLETNTRESRIFTVKHQRKANDALKALTDPRDIYEMNANMGARRLRACILGIIPGDVVDAAKRQCEITQQNLEGAPEDQLKKLVEAFAEIGISSQMLEKRLGHRLDATLVAEIVSLRKIYRSIADAMSAPGDWFDIPEETVKEKIAKATGEKK